MCSAAVGRGTSKAGRLPGVESSGEIRDVPETGATQQAGRDGASITTFAVRYEEFARI
jgi:hypothetical protein